ncbi:alpha-D-ribose 1-methylphosphonate 5-triphosphate diphosphatase [Sphingomonas sp. GlSt437]|uniref:alpha-D-ribose 1-methylphosphonate 5-triphosphate diphosphatase n=1 Tax=Sphingomonas sp. GlSt437 TaxID=3389970 RepID=UPI003A8C2B87
MTEIRFVNAAVVTPDAVNNGGVIISGGRIASVEPSLGPHGETIDLEGDYLIPGLIDIHTDNLERHYEPRPDVRWDALGAVLAHDGQMACAGITTVFDSIALHGHEKSIDRSTALMPMVSSLQAASEENILRAEHFLHLRCEVRNPKLIPTLEMHLDNPLLKLLSVMDHTPGQRQYRNLDAAEIRRRALAMGHAATDVEDVVDGWRNRQTSEMATDNWRAVVDIARERGLPLATHDDENEDHIRQADEDGALISEFPVTIEAAIEARRRGIAVFMGAPNLIRGGSHSGNVSAAEIVTAGALDGFASDYIPMSMLRAAFRLTEAPFMLPLPAAIATVTAAPARVTKLDDRGEIAPGKRADLVRVALSEDGWPVVHGVWREGRRVA